MNVTLSVMSVESCKFPAVWFPDFIKIPYIFVSYSKQQFKLSEQAIKIAYDDKLLIADGKNGKTGHTSSWTKPVLWRQTYPAFS
jgi:hypothetical protein